MIETGVRVRPVEAHERSMLADLLAERWGSVQIVSRGQLRDAARAPALGCFEGGRLVGLATFETSASGLQVLTLDAFERQRGIGSRLLDAMASHGRVAGCRRLWLITSNDNLDAIRFYQRRGLRLVAVHVGAIDQARKIKPTIPRVGNYGIELHDELEFEMRLELEARP